MSSVIQVVDPPSTHRVESCPPVNIVVKELVNCYGDDEPCIDLLSHQQFDKVERLTLNMDFISWKKQVYPSLQRRAQTEEVTELELLPLYLDNSTITIYTHLTTLYHC